MRHESTGVSWAVFAVGGVLLLCLTASALGTAGEPRMGSPPSGAAPPAEPSPPRQVVSPARASAVSVDVAEVARVASARAEPSAVLSVGTTVQRTALAPVAVASLPEGGGAAPLTSLPPATAEIMPDGLPVSALRCAFDGGVVECGGCRTDSDCPAGQGCVSNYQTRRMECMDSECEDDLHCLPGFLCRASNTGATGSLIRRCVPEGHRTEGEPCDLLPRSVESSCHEGLLCVNQVCTIPCRREDGASCPEGFTCTDSLNGPGCVPDCRRRGCPEGQRCRRTEDATYQCLVAAQGDCREPEQACPEGQHCNMRVSRGRGVFWCAPLCNPLLPESCPAGQVCGMGSANVSTCFPRCEPREPGACGEGQVCATVSEDLTLWGCRPDLSRLAGP